MGNLVWESTLDGRYRCTVVRVRPYCGLLYMTDGSSSRVLFEKEVGLSFDAIFGPDVADVAEWQDICIDVVENLGR